MKDEDQKVFTNREFSLIKFNERVLEEAERTDLPLGERLNFAAIYQSNMDDFFMVRVGKLVHKNKRTPQKEDALSGLTPKEQMKAICKTVRGIIPRRDTLFNELVAELDKEGFHLVEFKTLKAEEDRKKLRRYFER